MEKDNDNENSADNNVVISLLNNIATHVKTTATVYRWWTQSPVFAQRADISNILCNQLDNWTVG